MRSLYGTARLDASFCCFCERALALSELRLFPCPVFPFALSVDMRCRIARERVHISIYLIFKCYSHPFQLSWALGAVLREVLAKQGLVIGQISEGQWHRQLHEQGIAELLEEAPLALLFKVDNPMGKKNAPHRAAAQ